MKDNAYQLNSYLYELPENQIAKEPESKRDYSKLLVYNKGKISDAAFSDLYNFLPANALLVINDTKVIPARLVFKKLSGTPIEIFLLQKTELNEPNSKSEKWNVLVGNRKKFRKDEILTMEVPSLSDILSVNWVDKDQNVVEFNWKGDYLFSEILQEIGNIPLPPYLNRAATEKDKIDYQTVYAKSPGAVAAPTAGLHFTPQVFESLLKKNITTSSVTLHVGIGTFKPIKVDDVRQHEIHKEKFTITQSTLEELIKSKFIVPVGTTSLRVLESLPVIAYKIQNNLESPTEVFQSDSAYFQFLPSRIQTFQILLEYLKNNNLQNLESFTSIYIIPGFNFKVIDALITNFHQPGSTLLLLISAFIGPNWQQVYGHALQNHYRFLSYGDSSLLVP